MGRALRRYLLLQIASLVLFAIALIIVDRWFDLPAWFVPGALGLWIAKELALFPMLRRTLARRDQLAGDRLVGTHGVVTQALAPEGWVRAGGELWQARAGSGSIEVGAEVRVVELDHLVLVVEEVNARPRA